jgi:GDP-mannose 6-dehydrogenase
VRRDAFEGQEEYVRVAIIGLGYVGAVTAGCLARLGREVIGVDSDALKSEAVAAGRSPIAEPGLDELLAEGVAAGRIGVAPVDEAVRQADVIMIAVGTPSAPSGALSLEAVTRVADQIGAALPRDGRYRTIVVRSTVLPGTTQEEVQPRIEAASGLRAGADFGLAMNPEFLRESSSIRDFFETARTVIGADDPRAAEQVQEAYAGLEAPFLVVPIRTAEMVKYTDNAFHALKISFANEIASFARTFGVDGRQAMEIMISDDRLNISTAYLRPGYSFGGSCLPKDLRALTDRARKSDLDLPLLNAALASNAAHFERGVAQVEAAGGRRVAMLGLTFKAATDDMRESPAVALAERLVGRGFDLRIYDPDAHPDQVRGANRAFMEAHLPHIAALLCSSVAEVIDGADTVVVTKHWDELDDLGPKLGAGQRVVDLVGIPGLETAIGDRYAGIGW